MVLNGEGGLILLSIKRAFNFLRSNLSPLCPITISASSNSFQIDSSTRLSSRVFVSSGVTISDTTFSSYNHFAAHDNTYQDFSSPSLSLIILVCGINCLYNPQTYTSIGAVSISNNKILGKSTFGESLGT